MWFLVLVGSALGALNCSAYGLEAFDKLNVVTGQYSTPPLTTNRTVYFNPCAPIKGVPECGDDNHFCAVDEELINGRWERTTIKLAGSAELGMREHHYDTGDELTIVYAGAEWGDFYADGHLRFECGRHTGVEIDTHYVAEVPAVVVTTPRACDLRPYWPPRHAETGFRVWRGLWLAIFVVAALIVVYVCGALLATARHRVLGPLTEEAGRALYESPTRARGGLARLYERVTGRGTGRNTV